jgi:flagellar hook assembly protein FlgD
MATTDSISLSNSYSSLDGLSVNPQSVLDKDDFLQLLITQLQYQDPTSPMESQEILTQTSQLASLETQQNTNEALEELSASFKQNKNFAAVSSIGKMARLDTDIELTQNADGSMVPVNFNIDFKESVKSGTVGIYNEQNHLIKTFNVSELRKGSHSFTWDGLNDGGEKALAGDYKVHAQYSAYRTDTKGVSLAEDSDNVTFDISFEDDVEKGDIKIYNQNNEVVRTIYIGQPAKGEYSYSWDGRNQSGEKVAPGQYIAEASYEGNKPITLSADFGSYEIESVKFEDEKTFVKVNGAFISFDKVQEIYDDR